MAPDLPYNVELRSLLKDLADLNESAGPDELVALWFDTLYFPCQSYVDAHGQDPWRACFNDQEARAMAKFHTVFESIVDSLTMKWPDWRVDPLWREVSSAATVALREMDTHA